MSIMLGKTPATGWRRWGKYMVCNWKSSKR
nr:MAG TPA: hypothetical protein [Caudoviricetes sp.]